ncbi:MAG TPA: hypothetical protein VF549_10730 [Solirubrobacteraceae bacterium]|jgi:hypothetical protein
MAEDEQTAQADEEGAPSAASRAKDKAEAWEEAKEKVAKMEEEDEPPKDLKDWPDDEAKYITYGGGEGDHGYDEGPEKKLGPSSLERHEDGSITIEGEEVDNPDDYKAEEPADVATDVPGSEKSESGDDDGEDADDSGDDEKDEE